QRSRRRSERSSASAPAQYSVPRHSKVLVADAPGRTSGHPISGRARIRVYPISGFEMAGRRQPTWRDAPPAAQGDVQRNACYAAARRFAVRRPAGVVRDCLSIAAPLAPQLGPVFQALADFAFKAALGGIVELP